MSTIEKITGKVEMHTMNMGLAMIRLEGHPTFNLSANAQKKMKGIITGETVTLHVEKGIVEDLERFVGATYSTPPTKEFHEEDLKPLVTPLPDAPANTIPPVEEPHSAITPDAPITKEPEHSPMPPHGGGGAGPTEQEFNIMFISYHRVYAYRQEDAIEEVKKRMDKATACGQIRNDIFVRGC
jgi:hypothetical protein